MDEKQEASPKEPATSQSTVSRFTIENPWPFFGTAENKPLVCVLIGMAGSGKTTLLQRLNAHVHTHKIPSYIINLDPAVTTIPYNANIDIRDSLNYKEVMKQYNLGPNGGILTSLNLFSTRFDQVIQFVEKRAPHLKYVFLDTPGQIEVFTWSASGTIITESFASTFPTIFVYIVDTPRCTNPTTFMSNMLYACSILYKTKLPLLVVFNKTDILKHDFAIEWMQDFDAFEDAIRTSSNYMANFTQSLGLMLEEFYKNLNCVGVSAVTGLGIDELFTAIHRSAYEYETDYKVELQKRIAQKQKIEEDRIQREMQTVKEDIGQSVKNQKSSNITNTPKIKRQTIILEDLLPSQELPTKNPHSVDSDDDDDDDDDDRRLDIPTTRFELRNDNDDNDEEGETMKSEKDAFVSLMTEIEEDNKRESQTHPKK
jgi:GTPase SAR1 family protein